jgi:hypothetical protein
MVETFRGGPGQWEVIEGDFGTIFLSFFPSFLPSFLFFFFFVGLGFELRTLCFPKQALEPHLQETFSP